MENLNKDLENKKVPIRTSKENIRPIYLTKRILSQKDCADYCNGKVEWGSFPSADQLQMQIDQFTMEIEEMKNAGMKLGKLNDSLIKKVLKDE
jgi:hypothetical protein